jgi:sulfite reductase (NADPH) flavoprotein alpha-component
MLGLVAPPSLLSQEQAAQLDLLTGGLDDAGLWWLSGYAAGLARSQALAAPRPSAVAGAEPQVAAQLTIVYGSQTGNAKRVAGQLAQQVEAAGLGARLVRADAYATRELKNERHLAIVISTQGDGDPPDDARGFFEFVTGKRAPQLPELRYAVLALGDSSYPQFCAIGRRLDDRLAELGARRWFARGDADLDIDAVATPWLASVLAAAKDALKPQAPLATVTPLRPLASLYTREHPFQAELLVNQRITGRGHGGGKAASDKAASNKAASSKDVRHIELSLEGSGLRYEPGDALGIWPVNPPRLVDAVLATLELDGQQAVTVGEQTLPLREWLSHRRELTRLSRPFVATHAAHAQSAELNALLAPDRAADFARLLAERQVLDLLQAHPAAWTGEELVAALRPLAPRLYSIASSARAVGEEEVHLTVAHVEYEVAGGNPDDRLRWGAASNYLARAAEGEKLPVFIEHNERFRLPKDGTRDVILVGPGTGVAPFRGFVQERAASGATGRNWLFFGNPHARSDFLYQLEWQEALKRGALHRLDLAFSRDQAHQVYVQDRLREHSHDVFAWLEGGAHLYVCGDATRMAKDVHAALLEIVATHGGISAEDASAYLNQLQAQGRYARDVY